MADRKKTFNNAGLLEQIGVLSAKQQKELDQVIDELAATPTVGKVEDEVRAACALMERFSGGHRLQ